MSRVDGADDMRNTRRVDRIANVIKAIEEMRRYGGVLIRDGQDYWDDPDGDVGGYAIDGYALNANRQLVIIGSR